jgi:hypothetical protein
MVVMFVSEVVDVAVVLVTMVVVSCTMLMTGLRHLSHTTHKNPQSNREPKQIQ